MVNGNVLVPLLSERTPLAADPAVASLRAAHPGMGIPAELPNRTDINKRMLNTNSPQTINSETASARIDQIITKRDRLALRYQRVHQRVLAFQLLKGQNPDTTTRSHQPRITWMRQQSSATTFNVSLGFDRLASQLVPEKNNVGSAVLHRAAFPSVGPNQDLPIDRAENMFRQAVQIRRVRGRHELDRRLRPSAPVLERLSERFQAGLGLLPERPGQRRHHQLAHGPADQDLHLRWRHPPAVPQLGPGLLCRRQVAGGVAPDRKLRAALPADLRPHGSRPSDDVPLSLRLQQLWADFRAG